MKKRSNSIQFLCLGSIFTAMTVMLQAAPVFLPAIGLVLSPYSTLPIALATYFHFSLGVAVLASSSLLLVIISAQEAVILLFTTGILGIAIGALLVQKGIVIASFIASIVLTAGILALTYWMQIPMFLEVANSFSVLLIILGFYTFSFAYSLLWSILILRILRYLVNAKVVSSSLFKFDK